MDHHGLLNTRVGKVKILGKINVGRLSKFNNFAKNVYFCVRFFANGQKFIWVKCHTNGFISDNDKLDRPLYGHTGPERGSSTQELMSYRC